MPEIQYIKVSDTEFKEIVPMEKMATLDDLINLRDAALKRVNSEQAVVDQLDAKITAVRALGVKTEEEATPTPEPEPEEESIPEE